MLSVIPPELAKKYVVAGRPAYSHDLPGGRGDGGVGRGGFGGDPQVNLRARVGVDVEARPAGVGGERVGAARDRLGLQRRQRPARRHLGRDHAAHVALERDLLDLRSDEHLHLIAPAGAWPIVVPV